LTVSVYPLPFWGVGGLVPTGIDKQAQEVLIMWTEIGRLTTGREGTNENHSVTIHMEQRTLNEYGLPVFRVGATWGLSQKSHTRRKVFKGETAHMDAERMYNDLINEVRYS